MVSAETWHLLRTAGTLFGQRPCIQRCIVYYVFLGGGHPVVMCPVPLRLNTFFTFQKCYFFASFYNFPALASASASLLNYLLDSKMLHVGFRIFRNFSLISIYNLDFLHAVTPFVWILPLNILSSFFGLLIKTLILVWPLLCLLSFSPLVRKCRHWLAL